MISVLSTVWFVAIPNIMRFIIMGMVIHVKNEDRFLYASVGVPVYTHIAVPSIHLMWCIYDVDGTSLQYHTRIYSYTK